MNGLDDHERTLRMLEMAQERIASDFRERHAELGAMIVDARAALAEIRALRGRSRKAS